MAGKMFNFGAVKQLIASWKGIISTIIMALVYRVKIDDFFDGYKKGVQKNIAKRFNKDFVF